MLRLPDGMREVINELAKANGRSMNAEIIHRIQRTIDEDHEDSVRKAQLNEQDFTIVEGSQGTHSSRKTCSQMVVLDSLSEKPREQSRLTDFPDELLQELVDHLRETWKKRQSKSNEK